MLVAVKKRAERIAENKGVDIEATITTDYGYADMAGCEDNALVIKVGLCQLSVEYYELAGKGVRIGADIMQLACGIQDRSYGKWLGRHDRPMPSSEQFAGYVASMQVIAELIEAMPMLAQIIDWTYRPAPVAGLFRKEARRLMQRMLAKHDDWDLVGMVSWHMNHYKPGTIGDLTAT